MGNQQAYTSVLSMSCHKSIEPLISHGIIWMIYSPNPLSKTVSLKNQHLHRYCLFTQPVTTRK